MAENVLYTCSSSSSIHRKPWGHNFHTIQLVISAGSWQKRLVHENLRKMKRLNYVTCKESKPGSPLVLSQICDGLSSDIFDLTTSETKKEQ